MSYEGKAKGRHRFVRGFDPDAAATAACATGRCPIARPTRSAELQPWIDAVRGAALPAVALAPLEGGDIRVFPLPADPAAFWQLLENPR